MARAPSWRCRPTTSATSSLPASTGCLSARSSAWTMNRNLIRKGVGFAARGPAAPRAVGIDKTGILFKRIARAVRHQVFGQHHRQILFRHRHIAAVIAVNDGNGTAPVALTGYAPVVQAKLGAGTPRVPLFKGGNNGLCALVARQPVKLA